jgi:short-subunit dehydrogenase
MSKNAVITGAGAGIGRATAEEFARHGWNLALLSRDADRLDLAAAQLNGRYGIRALAIPMLRTRKPWRQPPSGRSTNWARSTRG